MTLQEFIQKARSGQFFTIEFIKRTTGEHRTMNARLGVKAYVSGVGRTFDPKQKNLLGVYDMQNHGYRMVNLEGLVKLRFEGKTYIWNISDERFVEVDEKN